MSQLGGCPQPPNLPSVEPAGTPRFAAGFLFVYRCEGSLTGTTMLAAEKCRDRAAECQRMADQAPNARVRDILLDIGRTWTRLALEVEQSSRIGIRPSARLTKAAPKNAPRGPTLPTPLPSRGSRRQPFREAQSVLDETQTREPPPSFGRCSGGGSFTSAIADTLTPSPRSLS